LRWYEHVLGKDENDWVKKCMDYRAVVIRPRGMPKKNGVNWEKRLPGLTLWKMLWIAENGES